MYKGAGKFFGRHSAFVKGGGVPPKIKGPKKRTTSPKKRSPSAASKATSPPMVTDGMKVKRLDRALRKLKYGGLADTSFSKLVSRLLPPVPKSAGAKPSKKPKIAQVPVFVDDVVSIVDIEQRRVVAALRALASIGCVAIEPDGRVTVRDQYLLKKFENWEAEKDRLKPDAKFDPKEGDLKSTPLLSKRAKTKAELALRRSRGMSRPSGVDAENGSDDKIGFTAVYQELHDVRPTGRSDAGDTHRVLDAAVESDKLSLAPGDLDWYCPHCYALIAHSAVTVERVDICWKKHLRDAHSK